MIAIASVNHLSSQPSSMCLDKKNPRNSEGFTLVELMLSMAILSVLMLVVVNVIGIVQQQWIRSSSRVTSFREARMAFDLLNRNLSQATLNTYWMNEVDPLAADAAGQERFKAKNYVRQSELQFVSGKTAGLLAGAAGSVSSYPTHGVFFQAPLGVTRLTTPTGGMVNTENMVNLLCARGYFVSWGDDAAFRPAFLSGSSVVPLRFRYRLMEYSPPAEANQIYYDPMAGGNLAVRKSIIERSKMWFSDVLTESATSNETTATRGFTRPVADNIIALVISPQLEASPTITSPESIAPLYEYDSTLVMNPGASPTGNPEGTRHLLPPLLKVTMVAIDSAAGERLAERENAGQQSRLAGVLAPLFTTAMNYNAASSSYNMDLATLENFLRTEKLNYRVFTSTIIMKQSRWSGAGG